MPEITETIAPAKQKGSTPVVGDADAVRERMSAFFSKSSESSSGKEIPQSTESPATVDKTTPQSTSTKVDKLPIPAKERKVDDGTFGMNAEQKKLFTTKAEEARELSRKVKEYEAKLENYDLTRKEKEELSAKYAELESRQKKNEARVAAADIRLSEKWAREIDGPLIQLTANKWIDNKGTEHPGAIPQFCAQYKLDPGKIFNAIYNTDEIAGDVAIDELIKEADLLDAHKRKLSKMVEDVRKIEGYSRKMMEEAPATWEAMQIEEKKLKEQEKSRYKDKYNLGFDQTKDIFLERMPFLVGEDKKPYPHVEEAFKSARSVDFDSLEPDVKAAYVQSGSLLPSIRNIIDAKDERIKSLEDALKRAGVTKPGPSPDKSRTQTTEDSQSSEDFNDPKKRSQDSGSNYLTWREKNAR